MGGFLKTPHHERNPRRLLVRESALSAEPVLAVEVAVVARHDDDRVLELSHVLEHLEDATRRVVDSQEHLEPTDDGVVPTANT